MFELTAGTTIDLGPLALESCTLYYEAYPDDLERYGDAGRAWCEHDSRYLLAWALSDAKGTLDCVEQVAWLGRVLSARDFPIDRLAYHVELVANLLHSSALGHTADLAAERMADAARQLRLNYATDRPRPLGPRPAGLPPRSAPN